MSKKVFGIVMSILVIMIGAMVCLNIQQDRENEKIWVASYEMTNKSIEWSGAGFNGYFEK